MCSFSTKNYAKMSVFYVKTLKIRGGWGLCPCLLNPGCAIGQAYEVLPPRNFGLATPPSKNHPFKSIIDFCLVVNRF